MSLQLSQQAEQIRRLQERMQGMVPAADVNLLQASMSYCPVASQSQ